MELCRQNGRKDGQVLVFPREADSKASDGSSRAKTGQMP
jgi:hypothetical protein